MRQLWTRLNAPIERFKDSLTEAQWDLLRAAAGLVGLGLIAALGYVGGRPLWRRWQHRQALAEAGTFLEQRDYRSMLLALQRATELAPMDFDTWRQVERDLADIGSPEALVADQQMSRLRPEDMSLRLATVQDALRFGRLDTAETELDRLSEAARRDVAFHRLAAALALSLGRSSEFEAQVAAIVAADPGDANARFTYASLRLWSADPAAAAAARAELGRLLAVPSVRLRAAIELLTSTARRRDRPGMAALLVRLLGVFAPGTRPDFSMPDPPAWNVLLAGMENAAAGAPSDTALMMQWLADIGRPSEAMAWLGRLPSAIQGAPVVLEVAARLEAAAGNLGALDGLLRREAWGPVPDDAVTLALASRIERLKYDAARARATWTDAVAACGDSVTGLRALARLADLWSEPAAAAEALQAVLAKAPGSIWAYEALRNGYAASGDIAALWNLYDKWRRVMPDDPQIAAEWILCGCVLDQATPEAYARAAALWAQPHPSRLVALAQAASLWRQGRPSEALSALQTLSRAELAEPSVALWVAVVEADLGDRQAASAALALASRPDLAEPERMLLRAAAAKLGLQPASG